MLEHPLTLHPRLKLFRVYFPRLFPLLPASTSCVYFLRHPASSCVILRLATTKQGMSISEVRMRMTNGKLNTTLLLLCIIDCDEAVYRASDKARYSGEGA